MKHTTGPWVTSKETETNEEYTLIADVGDSSVAIWTQGKIQKMNYKANANLIAAAPEMLEALEELLNIIGILRQGGVNVLAIPEAVKARSLAHAAIKKARGEK